MRFGSVPLAEAEGGILGHTYRIDGRPVVKGTRLGPGDLALLAGAGIVDVVVARLDPDDMHEDEAAAAVAAALEGDTVQAHVARAGRANLYARTPGVLGIDAVGVDDVNLVHESITLGTLAPWTLVEAGDMVATVKVIPFASPRHVVRACAARATGLLTVLPLTRRTAGLIATELPGTPEPQVRKAIEAQRARLERHGSRLGRIVRCPHRVADLQVALRELLEGGFDPVLLVGASATVDRNDVLPTAIRAVGGTVDHLGMPMDPGNQLFLAHVGPVTAIGVPGCARSTKPGGFDVVLRRVLAGRTPSGHDIMRLGVGGLMKARSVESPRKPRFAAIVLAAGQSRRMGERNKLLVQIEGQPMVVRVVDALAASRAVEIVVVTGHEDAHVRDALAGHPVRFVHNPHHADGMSTSVRAAVEALQDDELDGVVVALGDMPFVRSDHVDALISAYDPAQGLTVCVPVRGRKRGNPVLWGRRHLDELRSLTGDQGARRLLREHADAVAEVGVQDDAVFVDLDTPEALAGLRDQGSAS